MGTSTKRLTIILDRIHPDDENVVIAACLNFARAGIVRFRPIYKDEPELPFSGDPTINGEPSPGKIATSRYKNAIRNKGISGVDLIIQLVSTGPVSLEEMTEEFVEHGFSENTPGPLLSHLMREGRLVRLADGRYQLKREVPS